MEKYEADHGLQPEKKSYFSEHYHEGFFSARIGLSDRIHQAAITFGRVRCGSSIFLLYPGTLPVTKTRSVQGGSRLRGRSLQFRRRLPTGAGACGKDEGSKCAQQDPNRMLHLSSAQ